MTSRHGIAMERAGDEGEWVGWKRISKHGNDLFFTEFTERDCIFPPSPPLLLLEFIKGSDAAV